VLFYRKNDSFSLLYFASGCVNYTQQFWKEWSLMKKRCCLGIWVLVLVLLWLPEREQTVLADGHAALPSETKYVALTFDDGPHRSNTERLLDGLLERGTSATFFLVGEQIAGNEALIQRMAREGHQIGNHTWSHRGLQELDEEAFQAEIRRTEDALDAVLEQRQYWLRPPYGQISGAQLKQLDMSLAKWSVDPRDWESRNREKVVQAVLETVKPGSIILLHDIHSSSVEAALELVDRLTAQGYVFVTVEELFAL
jgi:peptidoglycan/xylan/chitin deacetylase (PgdA/CDA1 family)